MRQTATSIRSTLFGLTGFLGAALLLVVALQMTSSLGRWREMNELVASNQAREELARVATALALERNQTVLDLRDIASDSVDLPAQRARSDRTIEEAEDRIAALTGAQDFFAGLSGNLAGHRSRADAAASPADRAEAADAFQAFGIAAVNRLNSLRLTLLAQEQPADPATALAFGLRAQASAAYEYLMRSRTFLALAAEGAAAEADIAEIERNAVRLDAALDVMRGNPQLLGGSFPERIGAIRLQYYSAYRPVERAILAGDGPLAVALAESDLLLDELAALLDDLFATSRDRLSSMRFFAAIAGSLWLGLFLAGGVAVMASISVVRRRVVVPLGALSNAMLGLARDELDTPLPVAARDDEMRPMADALRVFRANALRRRKLQDERLALHGRLKDAYRQLKVDLEAAAVVQATLLPPPARHGGISFAGYFRPSHYIAGDTYDVVHRPDGRVDFFQIDVAGHGAPAALISVASHHSIAQASLQRRQGESVADLVAAINADWPESFPYFTMVVGEIDLKARRGCLVQAGHPSPLFIGRDGRVRPLGEGGLPVGILPGATYDEITFDFAPGDRLLLYSDGLVEAEDPQGRFFSLERLEDVVAAHARSTTPALLDALDRALRSWRGSGTLDDDVTVLILEAEAEDERARAGTRQRAGAFH
jgi:serine phosphatase RsbU (regulator of sigma subunit)